MLVQVLARHELHGDVERAVLGLAEVEDADGVGVVEAAGGLGLALEAGHGALVATSSDWRSTLSTTGLSSASCLARYTLPMPPSPIIASTRYFRATIVPM